MSSMSVNSSCSSTATSNGERPSFLHARDPSIDRRCRPRPDRQVRLFDEIREECADEDEDASSMEEYSSTSQDNTASSEEVEQAAMVYLRLRPVTFPSSAYTISEDGNVLIAGPANDGAANSLSKNTMERHYSFSSIFSGAVRQSEVYEMCIAQKIKCEDSFTVLTYGTSGSGKTFTLLGDDECPGIVPRALEHIFTMYGACIYTSPALKLHNAHVKILDDGELAKEVSLCGQVLKACENNKAHAQLQKIIQQEHNFEPLNVDNVSTFIWISFVEIYNELVYDLLAPLHSTAAVSIAPPTRKTLKVICNDGKVFIKGLTTVHTKSSSEALKLLRQGLQHVSYASTAINANSSRSHCIFFVDVLKYQSSGVVDEISYKFCDLAGSERLEKTRNVGDRLTEAKGINTSLMVLGRCLDAINSSRRAKGNKLIPYRESKLTMLLQAALLGKEKLAMVVNVTPTDTFYEENMNVLRFGSIAKNIIFKQPVMKQNKSRYSFLFDQRKAGGGSDEELHERIKQLLQENIYLRSEINRLNEEMQYRLLNQEQELRNELVDEFKVTLEQRKQHYETIRQRELNKQKMLYEERITEMRERYEEELRELRDEYEAPSPKRRTLD